MVRTRVLQLVTGLAIGEEVGGAELFGVQLARHLDRDLLEPAVVGLWRFDSRSELEWVDRLRTEGIQVSLMMSPTGRLAWDLAQAFTRLQAFVSAFQPDIVNSHSERGDLFAVLLRLFHCQHPYAVRTMHTDAQWQARPWLGAILSHLVFPVVCAGELAVSERIREALDRRPLARLRNRRGILCYNGIDAALFERALPPTERTDPIAGLSEDAPRIGIIGRLTEQKGHSDLLDAMRIVCRSRPVHLLVIGSGPLEDQLRLKARASGLEEYIHFLGSRDDVPELLAGLDLIVSSSLWEGFPGAVLEAMAGGVAVVATDVSGSRELVKTGETGMLVPPRAPERLADAIRTMLANPSQAAAMADRARTFASQFTIQNAATFYGRMYKQLLHAGRGSRYAA